MIQNSTAVTQNRDLHAGGRRRGPVRRISVLVAALFLSVSMLFPSLPAKASGNQDAIFEYLTGELDYSVAAACGIMANIYAESGYSTSSSSGGSYGLCQWLGGRRSSLYSWCSANGYSSSSVEGQLSFLNHELQMSYTSVYNYLQSVENTSEGARDAAYYFCYHYEAPANRGGQSSRRGSIAAGSIWTQYARYAMDMWEDTEEGTKYWHKEGYYHTGWLETDGNKYYFDDYGILKTGLFSAEGSTYFADEDGVIRTGWQTIDDSTYYFGSSGIMETGWIEVDGSRYYLEANGRLSSVNAFAEKSGTTDADIASAVTAQENAPEETVSAPAADPVGIEDKVADTVKSVRNAGAGTQTSADVASGVSDVASSDSGKTSDSSDNTAEKSAASQAGADTADTGDSSDASSVSLRVPDRADPSAAQSDLANAGTGSADAEIAIISK